jgi:hypothetical protein
MKQSLFKLFFIFGMFFSTLASLHAADECNSFFFWGSSDFSGVVNSTQNYTNSDSANGWGNDDTYYISVTEPGEVTITVTGNNIRFSYDESGCPNKGATPDATTGTYTFLAAGDFNLRVYRSNGNAMENYTLDITFTPFTCNNFKVDDDKNQCSDACYTTITDAIDAASANQEILICDGTYNENLVVSKDGLILKGESGNRANVLIQNSAAQPTVALNGVNGVTLDTLSIADTTSRDAVSIGSYSQNIVLKNLLLNSGRDALHTNGGNGRLELYDSVLQAGDDGIDIAGQINDGLLLSHLDITSTDRGLTSSGDLNGDVSILNSTITAGAEGVVLNNPVNATTTIDNLKVTAQNEGLSFKGELNGVTTLSAVDVTAGSNAVAIYKKINNGMSINGLSALTPNVGLLFNDELNGDITLQNMTIQADAQALFFAHNINNNLSISNSSLTSINNRGMYVGDNAYGTFSLSAIAVTAKNEGLYFPYDKQISPVITDSNITSSDSDAVFTRSTSWTTLTLRDSCVKTEKSGKYGLNHYINGSNSHINGSCFYATDTSELARAQRTGNDFSGNYWDGVGGNYTQNNISDTSGLGSCPHGCGGSAGPLAEWRFDECEWDGTVDEVQDSINAYHATAQNGAMTTDDAYQINRAGYFDGVNDVIIQDDLYSLLKATASLSFWIKTTQIGGSSPWTSPGVTGVEQRGGADDIFWGWLDTSGRIGITAKSDLTTVKSTNPINDDAWHHVVLSRDHLSGEVKIYVDGVFDTSGVMPAGVIGNSFNRIGGIVNTYGSTFEGYLDEIKIYDTTLDDNSVLKVYNNEVAGKNYDGSNRDASLCGPTAEYRMDACDVTDVNWTLDASGNGYTATFTGDKLSMQEGKICAGVEILRDTSISEVNAFKAGVDSSSLGDVGTIMFWYRSNQKWDVSPGKMLVDSTKGDKYFFLGLRSDGRLQYYLEDNRDGDFQSTTTTRFAFATGEWVHLSMSWDFPAKSFKLFVNGIEQSLSIIQNSAGGSGRHIPSGLNELFIGDISFNYTQNPSVYDGLRSSADGRFDEVKLFNKILTSSQIATGYTREDLGRNYNSNQLRICQTCVYEPLYRGFFDAWDIFRDISDRNISTKIVSQNFQLTLASLNETQDALADFNGTICSHIVDTLHTNASKSSWTKTLLVDANSSTMNFTVPYALQQARVGIVWKKDVDEACPLSDEDNSTLSSDAFAIRPESFTCNVTASPLVAEHNYSATITATQYGSNTSSPDYNTTGVVISAKKYMNNGDQNDSLNGSFSISGLTTFSDGNALGYLGFDDVGIVGIDINDSTWATVDVDDTLAEDREIHHECNRTFTAHHFDVNLSVPIIENNSTFTYLSNDLNMSAWIRNLDVTVSAKGELGKTLLNYQEPQSHYFAKNVDVTPILTLPDSPYGDAANTLDVPLPWTDENLSFAQGVADINYSDARFNYPRTFNDPKNPFLINGVDGSFSVDVNEHVVTSVSGSDTTALDDNATFYFGRLHPKDVKTTDDPAVATIEIEVFDDTGSNFVQNFRQNSLHWYRHANHNSDAQGDAMSIHAMRDLTLNTPSVFDINPSDIADPSNGTINVSIPKHDGRYYLHVKTQEWLWYVPGGFGTAYNESDGSQCTEHPCFNYTSKATPSREDISTGSFQGSDFSEQDRGDYTKKGIKVFR